MCLLRAQVGDSLEEFLVASTSDTKLRQLLMSMSEAIRTIGFKARPAVEDCLCTRYVPSDMSCYTVIDCTTPNSHHHAVCNAVCSKA